MEAHFLTPPEIAEAYVGLGKKKAGLSPGKKLLLGFMAGAFIAFASAGSNAAIHTIESVGLAKTLAGALFSGGLILVLISGGELFTGNCLLIIAWLEKKIKLGSMVKSWLWVYCGNFAGAFFIAVLMFASGQFGFSHGLLGGYTIKVAVTKVSYSFLNGVILGILCNWLVCCAVWMAAGAKDISGKVWAIFFPIWIFIASGFEHSIANMYYIPAGILAKSNGEWVAEAMNLGVTAESLAGLNWPTFLSGNLLPVTLGNIVGGACFVGLPYWLAYIQKSKKED